MILASGGTTVSLWKFQLLHHKTGSNVCLRLSGISRLAHDRLSSNGSYIVYHRDVKMCVFLLGR